MTTASFEGKTKIIVTGDDDFDDYRLMKKKLQKFTFPFDDVVIYIRGRKGWSYEHGRPTGVEYHVERWVTKRLGVFCIVHPNPKIKRDKREYAQIKELLHSASRIIVFWNGYDSDTEKVIDKARELGLKLKVVKYG